MSDLANWKVHGPVQTLKTEVAEWDLRQGQWLPPRTLYLCVFRPDGKISQSDHHNLDGSVAHTQWLYDEAGRLVESQFWINDGEPDSVLYQYDSTGRFARTVHTNRDGSRSEGETCTYDSSGRRTKLCVLPPQHPGVLSTYRAEGSETGYPAPGATTMTTIYDERDLPAEVRFTDAHQQPVSRVVLLRDDAGRLVSEEMYMDERPPVPDLRERLQGAPPEAHAQISALLAQLLGPDQAFSRTAYEYGPDGRLLVRSRSMAAIMEERTTFRYDDHGNEIEEITERKSRSVGIDAQSELRTTSEDSRKDQIRFDYKYDARGNWVERVVWGMHEPNADFQRSDVERREISYYEA